MNTPHQSRYHSSLTPDLVRELYLVHLGRPPESHDAIEYHLRSHNSREALEAALQDSPESKIKAAVNQATQDLLSLGWSQKPTVDVEIPTSSLAAMFARIQRQWETLGNTDPYWSVLSTPEFKGNSFEKNRAAFFESGRTAAGCVESFCQRNGVSMSGRTLIELGCGVGRVTVHLAKLFDTVIAIDISPGNLARCRAHVAENGLNNVTTILLKTPSQLSELPAADFFYSIITLQHNPPPIAAFFLEAILRRVRAGGAALFQIPTHTPGYRFNADAYLCTAHPDNGMEMHCVPMAKVYDILHENDFVPLETLADPWTGQPGSHTFFAARNENLYL